jgi:hypothetical protein
MPFLTQPLLALTTAVEQATGQGARKGQ